MNTISRMFNLIKRGLKGLNQGLSMGLPRLEAIMDGIQRQTYTIICGGTGSGKTTLALYSYVYKPLVKHLGDKKFRVVYFSMEMTAEILLAKLMCLHIYETYGIEITYKQVMSRGKVLSQEMFELVESCVPWLEQVLEQLVIIDKQMTAKGLYAAVMQYAKENGTFHEGETSTTYEPHIKDELVLLVVDHLGLLSLQNGEKKKDAMDLASKFMMRFRNMCGYSPLVLLQLNRTQSSMDRRNNKMQEIELSDIKDTGGPSEDAEVIMAIYHPYREKVAKHGIWDIKIMKDKYRAVQILKSRLGEADLSIPVNFHGSIGYWKELPPREETQEMGTIEYEEYLQLVKPTVEESEPERTPAKTGFSFRL